ncbi:uncharacterized protein LOC128199856 isoform X1 [Bicyclus anynana]|uniref:Uncharacterized protein LOC128199856 isoform X1 n=1 Tax=Bicyclus anynana TaxID=110368 RepID=A0ABM3M7N0_BICAN|nr:uncharacterized protein LOC128199856 isoform X1 [Bicyclus anynana]
MLARCLGSYGWITNSTVPCAPISGKRVNNNRKLLKSLVLATHAIDRIAVEMYTPEEMRWQKTLLGHTVMFASALVVVGVWWLVKTALALLINLVCPILVVVLAVVCVPQLRVPLLGQNYPLLANILRSILLKLAENIKV